nr:hypothetical protein [Ardenticatena sp.]
MRFLLDQASYDEMKRRKDHTPDCYVRPGEYLHHLYRDGVKYVVARALFECIKEAKANYDTEALAHLMLHKRQLDKLVAEAKAKGRLNGRTMLGDPPPSDEEALKTPSSIFKPPVLKSWDETGLERSFGYEMILRVVYNRGRATGVQIARDLALPYKVIEPLLTEMRQAELIDVVGQRGFSDLNYEYALMKRGTEAVHEALKKTEYNGPAPVPFETYVKAVEAQSPRYLVVTRRNIREAFKDLIVTDAVLNEIGPAINSASSIFLFGYPGNGKTSIAERITRLMGDAIYIPHAVIVEGQIIKMYDSVVHEALDDHTVTREWDYDTRWVRIKRPVVVTGGELTLPMLDLSYNAVGKFYEAPLQMKANGGIFMIDDFGRQQVRPMDLLNRWIVPLEKRYDYLTMVTGKKLEVPFELLLIFSTNLDPHQLADEAFLRRIKFKIEIRDPDEWQWREIWRLVCRAKGIELDEAGLDYMLQRWFRPYNRPLRMCQPRDILNQMMSIAKYNMESVTFSPDLIDAAIQTYFVSEEARDFGAAVRLA